MKNLPLVCMLFFLCCACSEPLEILEKSVIQNPYGHARLCAQLNLRTDRPCKIRLELFEKGQEDKVDISKTFDRYDTLHEIPVLGLYQKYENRLRVSFLDEGSNVLLTDMITIETDSIRAPDWQIRTDSAVYSSKKYFVNSPLRRPSYIYDRKGEVRAYYEGLLLKELSNGNYIYVKKDRTIVETTKLGKELNSYEIPQAYKRFHHEIYELPNGNLLVGAEKKSPEAGPRNARHMALELGKEKGELIHVWNVENFADSINRALWRKDPSESGFHFNAVIYDSRDSSLIFSGRHQGIMKVGYQDKELKWLFTPHAGFERSPSGLTKYLLTAVDEEGTPFGKTVQSKTKNIIDDGSTFSWPVRQHNPIIIPSADGLLHLLVFNNDAAVLGHKMKSLMIEYAIDEQKKTVFQYRTFDGRRYAKEQSGVDHNPEEEHYLMFSAQDVGVLTEFDHTGTIIFQAKGPRSGYRINYLESLY